MNRRGNLRVRPRNRRRRFSAHVATCIAMAVLVVSAMAGTAPDSAAQNASNTSTVDGEGAGSFELGSDLATLRQQLPDGWTVGPRVAIPIGDQTVFGHVIRDGDNVALLTATIFEVGDRLHLFLISSDRWATPEGVTVGLTVSDVAAVYGTARTGAGIDDDRIFVTFDDNPDRRVRFVVGTRGPLGERVIETMRLQCVPGTTCPGDPGQSAPTTALSNLLPPPSTTRGGADDVQPSTSALATTGDTHAPYALVSTVLVTTGLALVRMSTRRTRRTDALGPNWSD